MQGREGGMTRWQGEETTTAPVAVVPEVDVASVTERPRLSEERRQPGGTSAQTVSLIIPAYNESETLGPVIERIRGLAWPRVPQLLVIDDGSDDGTGDAALRAGAEVIVHRQRRGNGRAIKSGLAAARGEKVVILDGDGQHDPEQVPLLLAALDDGADLVVARRTAFRGSGLLRELGNHLLAALASYMTRSPVPDLTSGFRAFREETMRPFVPMLPEGFSTPTTSTLAYLHSGLVVRFLPVPPRRRAGSGRTHTRLLRDGPGFLTIAVRVTMLFRPARALAPLGVGVAVALWIALAQPVDRWWAVAAVFVPPAFMIFDGLRRLRRATPAMEAAPQPGPYLDE